MPSTTPNLALPFLLASQADKHVSVNSALTALDSLVQTSAVSRTTLSQPVAPNLGDVYLLPSGKTGAVWSTMADGVLATWNEEGWLAFTPRVGFIVFVQNEGVHIVRTATGWAPLSAQVMLPAGGEPLINGSFSIWQRGISLSLLAGQAGYLADRWRHEAGAGGTVGISRFVANAGTQGLPEWAYYGLRHVQTTAGTTPPRIEQRVEALRRFGASTVTFSAFLRVAAGTAVVTPKAVLNFGSGAPAPTTVTAAAWVVTTNWQRLSATFVIPSIGATTTLEWANNSLSIGLDLPIGAVITVDICAAQLDSGTSTLPVRVPDSVNELARCQRYFAKTFAIDTAPAPNTADGGGIFQSVFATGAFTNILPWNFPMPMRAVPQLTTYNPYSATGIGMSLAGSGNFLLDNYAINQNGVMLRNTTILSGAPLPVNLHVTANAEL
jgi:hypothetical protein